MVKIYYRLIKIGKMKIAEVPAKWKDAVRAMLVENGIEFEEETVEEASAEETDNASTSTEETTTTTESAEDTTETETTETSETVE